MADPQPSEFTLDRFKAEVRSNGLSRTNRFAVFFTYPTNLARLAELPRDLNFANPNDIRKALLLCESVQIPGHSFATIQNRTFGEFREIPYEKLYEPVTFNFYVDNDLRVKHMFDEWSSSVMNPVTRRFGYYENYTTNIDIMVYDMSNKETYRVTLFEAYPKAISAIQMDNNSKDIMKLNVTMQFRFWSATPSEYMSSVAQIVPSAGLMGFYQNRFDRFQEGFNNFASGGNISQVTERLGIQPNSGGFPGFDGLARDAQGFITTFNNTLNSVRSNGILNTLGGLF